MFIVLVGYTLSGRLVHCVLVILGVVLQHMVPAGHFLSKVVLIQPNCVKHVHNHCPEHHEHPKQNQHNCQKGD
eukprot:Skav221438  [mRNA]  locus=scaffold140:59660:59878:- [translate_table: standard]